jgi:D-threo-aldose 1-dehydrogenase
VSHVTLPGTDLPVSRLGFGTASLHHAFWQSDRVALLSQATDLGLTHIDTSPYYGDGLAESDIGALPTATRTRITIATKVGLYPRMGTSASSLGVRAKRLLARAWARAGSPVTDLSLPRCQRSLHESLRRMRVEHVHLLLLHEPDWTSINHHELLEWLCKARNAGTIGSWGIAGTRHAIEPALRSQSLLGNVVQTADSLEAREADFLSEYGRPMQITYGYLRRTRDTSVAPKATDVLRAALSRNSAGTVLVSTRNQARLSEIAKLL